ncbi:ABC-F family ATP-binding cassette domain-containing protein [Sulfitobacter sp. G21635-S1]|uniref:ABC-F family ATP-binding cassette domain-containing protein n=1 Tax=Sulfitobacter sp. G21635-S1 TaxID=3014043 RepID=UPI0022AE57A8|nr:ABC-F family ATP-binding cassette domain-containing protein [Sulfitobacter sp. G21635-S1]MCZ4256526.1 ABC-F family ATP-binding cassette domain-containing protein [Sulfitobacter sp. G21635-S1]
MTIININALGVTLGASLFSDLSLNITRGDRIGLVAANGRGKTTLLQCLAGELDPTTGEITRARGLRIGYVAQNLPEAALGQTLYDRVLAALPAEQAEYEGWRVDVVLDDLKVPYDIQHKELGALSGGWQRTAMLASVWITEPDVLLLDEPTNHLDLQRIGLLQGWLAALPRDVAVVTTSHDRAFLDETTNRTLFLRAERSRVFQLPYSAARGALDEADAADERRFANDLNKAQQLRRQAAKLKNIGINSGSDLLVVKTRQLNERAAQMEAAARPAHQERSAGEIRLTNSGTHAKALITLDDVPVETPGGDLLYRTGQKWILPGDRVVLLGGNGTGKTRLVMLIAQALTDAAGPVKCAPSVVPAISDQHLSQLSDHDTPMTAITGAFDIGDQRARGVLAGAGVEIGMQDRKIGALSGGQKARLAMLVLRLKNPNFYLLDEPTNHLDIEGQEALEQELIAHGASCLLVSHDRSFLRQVGTRFWWIRGGKLEEVASPEPFLAGEMGAAPG